jgi:hypothetical protein
MRRVILAAGIILACAGIAVGLHPHGFNHLIGVDTQQSVEYAFFSGFGAWLSSTLGLSTIIGTLWHNVNCRDGKCLRIGHFPDSRGVRWCWRHHPDHQGQKPTTELLHRLHFEHRAKS